ncbi:O-antigen ligase family protein [Elusimicrobiota bacterium]
MNNVVFSLRNEIIKYTEKILSIGLPLLYFLVAVGFYLKTYDSAQIKITFTQIGGAVIVAVWLVKIIEEDIFLFFKKNILIIFPLLAFLLSGLISHLHSSFPYASSNELIRRVIYMCIAMLAISEINSREKMVQLFNWLIAATFVVSIYGLIQYLDFKFFPRPPEPGLDPFVWRGAFGERIFSTFGNPNFFGDFLVVMSPVVLALFFLKKQAHLFVLWALMAFCAMFTFSKGTWLGFAIGFVIFVILYVGYFANIKSNKVRGILIGFIIAVLLFAGIGTLQRLSKRSDSASFRIFTWLSTWEMINTKPVFGTGIGSFYVSYPAFRRPQIFFIEGKHNTETDHSENEYIEVWADEGIFGFGIFLALLTVFLFMGFRNLRYFTKRKQDGSGYDIRAYYQLGLLTAVMAQLAHNFVCVSLRFVSSGVMLWLFIGLIGSLAVNNPLPNKFERVLEKNPIPENLRRMLQAMILLLAAYFVWVFCGYFKADMEHNRAIFFSKQAKWEEALKTYEGVVSKNPSFIMAYYFMGNVYNDRWSKDDAHKAIEKYGKAWELAPNYVQSHHQAGLIYLKWGQDENRLAYEAKQKGNRKKMLEHEKKKKELWMKALEEFDKYRMIDPIYNLNYYRMAWIYMQLGEKTKAEEIYKMHLDFPEELQKPPHSAWVEDWAPRRAQEYSETSVNLGNLRFMQNDFKKAEEYYKKSIDLYPDSINAMKNLAILYSRTNRKKLAGELWQKIRVLAPNDPDVKKVFNK